MSNLFDNPNPADFLYHVSRLKEGAETVEEQVPPDIRDEVYESWIRSERAGVDKESHTIPMKEQASCYDSVFQNEWRTTILLCNEHIRNIFDVVKLTDSLFIATDLDLNIVLCDGKKALLNKLKKINFGIGTNLSENIVGTNAIALCERCQSEAWVIGEEHYLDILKDYGGFAFCGYDFKNTHIISYAMVIAPMERFNPVQQFLFAYFARTFSMDYLMKTKQTELNVMRKYLKQISEHSDKGIIMLDAHGVILDYDAWIADKLGLDESAVGKRIFDMIPDLKNMLYNDKDMANYTVKKIMLNLGNDQKLFYITHSSVRINDNKIGELLEFSTQKEAQGAIAKDTNLIAQYRFSDLLGQNEMFVRVKREAENASMSFSTILITGSSGTGKELFAQAIHNKSERRYGPFVPINCGAIPKELIGSELFGYVPGAFTGARKEGSMGKFEMANEGTLFLDEIGEMPLDMQLALLRVLEERSLIRIGGGKRITLDVRIICATNKDLWQLVAEGKFRQDLYFRINVIHLELPDLSERNDDILLLAEHFIKRFNQCLNRNIKGITPKAKQLLLDYSWPGNIRELKNAIERSFIKALTSSITADDLPKELHNLEAAAKSTRLSLDDYELQLIQGLLAKHRGNKTLVAEEMQITRTTLYKKLKKYNLYGG